MAGSILPNPEVPVVLACQDNVFVVVPQSLLIKESTVFRSQLSTTWLESDSTTPLAETSKKRKRESETAMKETAEIIQQQSGI